MTSRPIDNLLPCFEQVKQKKPGEWQARCPAHDDKQASLGIYEKEDGTIIFKCYAGCQNEAIMSVIGKPMRDLFPPKTEEIGTATQGRPRIVATYDYTDGGTLVYQSLRYVPKTFKQRRPDGAGGWLWNMQGVTRVLFHREKVLEAVANNRTVVILEGEKDVLSAEDIEIPATCNVGGAGKWQDIYSEDLRGANVVIVLDNDLPGNRHGVDVAKSVLPLAASVRILSLPGQTKKGADFYDWKISQEAEQKDAKAIRGAFWGLVKDLPALTPETLAEFEKQVIAEEKAAEEEKRKKTSTVMERPADRPSGLPVIETGSRQLRDKTADALAALVKANNPTRLFVRDGRLIRVGFSETGAARTENAGENDLTAILARAADWVSTTEKRGVVPVVPPVSVVRDLGSLLSLRGWVDLPPIKGIVTAPIVSPDGTLSQTPGYLPGAAVYYHAAPGVVIPDTTPTPGAVAEAKNRLLGTVLKDFPFKDDASRAHALALILTPFVRPMINGPAPMFLITAPTQGTGKSLLAETCVSIFSGDGVSATTLPEKGDESEWRKQITASLFTGSPFVWFDNLRYCLKSASLAQALTAPVWENRELGTPRNIILPIRCVWIVTGNNIELDGDFPRRSLWVRLDAQEERPELRGSDSFTVKDLRGYVQANRSRLIADVLILIRAWLEKGKPEWKPQKGQKELGSFESFCRIMGGILDTVGVPGFLTNQAELYDQADPEREKWGAFFEEWHKTHGKNRVGVAEVIGIASDCEIIGDTEKGSKNYFGKLLRSNVDRVIGGYQLTKAKEKGRLQQYTLSPLATATGGAPTPKVYEEGVL